jgi:Uri superfamily endonuclease
MATKGAYCLCINVRDDITVEVGALGSITFPHGEYVYVGSALNSLEPRVERHLHTSTGDHDVTHWHIDYLLREPAASIQTVYFVETDEKLECSIAEKVSEHGQPVKGFGCSDCRCVSHLYRVEGFGFIGKMGMRRLRGSPRLP